MRAHPPLFARAGDVVVMASDADLNPEVLRLGDEDLGIAESGRDLEPTGPQFPVSVAEAEAVERVSLKNLWRHPLSTV